MTNLAVIFLTGLTSGGLSCLAVQGGLLASSVAHQVEQTIQEQMAAVYTARPRAQKQLAKRRHTRMMKEAQKRQVSAIALFLGAKLVAYTILGFFLGWIGSVLQLTPFMRAVLQIAIGIFMLGTALRMLDVHPIFRYFALEPPSALTRYIRRKAKTSAGHLVTPVFLGALTVFIPCGVTQVMMASAIGTGTPLLGAAIMFSFTLGASPIFFTLAYLATRLGEKLEARFLQVVAVTVFALGLVSINGGLNLMGAPFSLTSLRRAFLSVPEGQPQRPAQPLPLAVATTPSPQPPPAGEPTITIEDARATLNAPLSSWNSGAAAQDAPGSPENNAVSAEPSSATAVQVITVNVLDFGYDPNTIQAQPGQPVQLNLVTHNSYSCGRAFVIPDLNLQTILPETGVTPIEIPAQAAGSVLYFTCAMGMFSGLIQF